MPPIATGQAEAIVAGWRTGEQSDSPAGPLFTSGEYAEADITLSWRTWTISGQCGTACTYSYTRHCC